MSEEEKKAIEQLNKRYKFISENPLATNVFTTLDVHNLGIIFNLIDKLQKENEELKDYKERTEHTIKLAKATQRENEKLKEQLKAFTGIDIY